MEVLELPRILHENLALLRHREGLFPAPENLHAVLRFQLANVLAHSRLGERKNLRRFGIIERLRYCKQRIDLCIEHESIHFLIVI